jgi:3-dehydroquinate synthase
MRRVTVALDPAYDIIIGAGAAAELEHFVGEPQRVHVVTQEHLVDKLEPVWGALGGSEGLQIALIGDGEAAKSLDTVGVLCRAFAQRGLRRNDTVIAVGGGVVGDTAGFAAAVYHRGIKVVQVPTTLLAQVDAAIGGKTAVNIPEGKNLIGAFHQPIAVVADTSVLATLPDAEYRSGLGEVAKYALMPEGNDIAATLESDHDRVLARDPETLSALVAECAAIKAGVVVSDPNEESGVRARLNLGHTLGHAIETVGDYSLSHGEAVAVGLVFASALAAAMELVGPDAVDHARAVVARLGLPVTVPGQHRASELLAVMERDKKSRGGLTFVLPHEHSLGTVDDPPAHALDKAFEAVGVET